MKKRPSGNRRCIPGLCDAATLYAEKFAEPDYLLPELILAGHLTLVVGRPKSLKTWLVLALAIAVALSRKFLGRRIATPGRVLFCEFDDGRQQLNQRLHLLLPQLAEGEQEALKNITFVNSIKPLSKGGIGELEQHLRQARRQGNPFRLLVIDPYLAVRSHRKKGDLVAADYQEIAALRQLCMRYQCTGILVHHMKKGKSQYTSDQILGTTGVSAAVDGWWAIADDPHNPRCKIVDVRGRSIPETVLRIGFNPKAKHPGVYIVDQGIELKAGPQGMKVLQLLKNDGPKTPMQIAQALEKSSNSTHQLLSRLRERELVLKNGAQYEYPVRLVRT